MSVGKEASRLPLSQAVLLKCLDHLLNVLFLLRQKPCLLVPHARPCVPGAWERAGLAQGWCSLQQLKTPRRKPSSRWLHPAHLPPYLCKCSPDTPGLLASWDRQPCLCGLCLFFCQSMCRQCGVFSSHLCMLASAVLALSVGPCELCAMHACIGQKPVPQRGQLLTKLSVAKMLLVAVGTNQIEWLSNKRSLAGEYLLILSLSQCCHTT